MMENSNLFTKTNSKNWIKLISNFNQLWKLRQYGIIFLASAVWNIKNKIPAQQTKPGHNRNLRKRETIQSPKHEQLITIEKIVEQGKVITNGRGKYQGKQKLFSWDRSFLEKVNPTNSLWFLPK